MLSCTKNYATAIGLHEAYHTDTTTAISEIRNTKITAYSSLVV